VHACTRIQSAVYCECFFSDIGATRAIVFHMDRVCCMLLYCVFITVMMGGNMLIASPSLPVPLCQIKVGIDKIVNEILGRLERDW